MTETDINEMISRAFTAFRIGEIDLAEKLIRSIEETLPPTPQVLLLMGNIYSKRGKYQEAVQEYKSVLEIQPDNAEAHNNIGIIYRHLGKIPEALNELKTAAGLEPKKADIHYNLGNAYKQFGDLDNAAKEYRKAIEINPSFTLAYNNLGTLYDKKQDYSSAEAVYRKGLESDKNNPSLKYNLGLNYQNRNMLNEAKDSFKAALKARPGWIDSLNNLGIVLHKLGQQEESIQAFKAILRREPKNTTAKNNIGTVLQASGKTGEAERFFREALSDDPTYVKAGLNLGALLQETGSVKESYLHLAAMLKQDPSNVELRLLLAGAATELEKYSESESHLAWILSKDQKNIRALKQMGLLHFKRGNRKRGELYFRKILSIEPDARIIRIELASVFRGLKLYPEAETELKTILASNKEDIESWLLLAELYMEQGKNGTAVVILLQILDKYPDNHKALSGLARAYHAMGETMKAAETVNQLVNLQGNRATPDDLSTLNDSLNLYEEVLKSFEKGFNTSWEETVRSAVVLENDKTDIEEDIEEELTDEQDSLLFFGLDGLEEFAPTLLDGDQFPAGGGSGGGSNEEGGGDTEDATEPNVPREKSFNDLLKEGADDDVSELFKDVPTQNSISRENAEPAQPYPPYVPQPQPMYVSQQSPSFTPPQPVQQSSHEPVQQSSREPYLYVDIGPENMARPPVTPSPAHISPDHPAQPQRQEPSTQAIPEERRNPVPPPESSQAGETEHENPRPAPRSYPERPFSGSSSAPFRPAEYPPEKAHEPLPDSSASDRTAQKQPEDFPEEPTVRDTPAMPEREELESVEEPLPVKDPDEESGTEEEISEKEDDDAAIEPEDTWPIPREDEKLDPEEVTGTREPISEPQAVNTDEPSPCLERQDDPEKSVKTESFAEKEVRLLEHLLGLSQFLPPEKRNPVREGELRLKVELLKARLLGRQGVKKEIERRSGFMLPEPKKIIRKDTVERTFQYLSNLVESYPDAGVGHALKTKVSNILERFKRSGTEKSSE